MCIITRACSFSLGPDESCTVVGVSAVVRDSFLVGHFEITVSIIFFPDSDWCSFRFIFYHRSVDNVCILNFCAAVHNLEISFSCRLGNLKISHLGIHIVCNLAYTAADSASIHCLSYIGNCESRAIISNFEPAVTIVVLPFIMYI